MSKDAVNRDFTFRVMSRLEEIQVPCLPSGRYVIPSGRPSVYCSIRPDDLSSCPDAKQSSIIRPDPYNVSRSFCSSLYPSGHFSSTSRHLSVLEQFTDSFQVPRKGRSINRPDDVVSRPDACLRKARIAIQNWPSERLTAVVRTLVHRIW
jgi:hypothetical protein